MIQPPTPETVLACFSTHTGIRLRYLSYNQRRVAEEFCIHFTLEELAIVIAYIQRQIQKGRLDERSLSFRNIFGEFGGGNELASFQDRLALATKQVRLRPPVREVATARQVDSTGDKVITFQPVPTADTPDAGAAIAQQLAEFRRTMKGGVA